MQRDKVCGISRPNQFHVPERRAKSAVVAALALLLGACLNAYIAENRKNLAGLTYGMTQAEAQAVMGNRSVRSYTNPYRSAMFREEDGTQVDVLYYWTDGTGRDGVQDSELTPVVFRDGRLAGWGREFWREYSQKVSVKLQ